MKAKPKLRYAPDLLKGKVALVTGGGTNIGKATALEMTTSGAAIALFGRRLEPLLECASEIVNLGGVALPIQGDIRDAASIEAAMEQIKDKFGRLDILINNAGGQYVSPAKDISNKGFEAVVNNNLIGSWKMTKAAADHFMLANGGRIVYLTVPTRSGLRGYCHTAAARGGITALMKTLAAEWAEYGIQLNCVSPGIIRTSALSQYPIAPDAWDKNSSNVLKRLGDPADVAGTIIFLCSELGDFITGEDIYIDGGSTIDLAYDVREIIDQGIPTKRASPTK